MLSCALMDGYCLAQLFEEETSGFPPKPHGNDTAAIDRRFDDTYCWVCSAAIVDVHCKIVCKYCGFMRDCSDP